MQSELAHNSSKASPARNVHRFLRDRFTSKLAGLVGGRIRITDAFGSIVVGDESAELSVELTVHDTLFYEHLAKSGSVGAGESFALGHWDASDLVALVRILAINMTLLDKLEGGTARVGAWLLKIYLWSKRNTRQGSKKNIADHYDLGNDLFKTFLDDRMMYSSAVFRRPDDSLNLAQEHKLDSICKKLDLKPGDHVIEIGSGWGGFAVFAATNYGCRVTTTTISEEQYSHTKKLVAEFQLENQITVLKKDYRDLQGVYDKLVSIEMIEAVGADYLDAYLNKCCTLLKPDGVACIQAITIEDHRYESAVNTIDFIKRFIFPGSFIPALSVIMNSIARKTDFRLEAFEEIGSSYSQTLAVWRERFLAKRADILAMGYSEEFVRLWQFYFCYCEGGFRQKSIGAAQLCFTRSANTREIPGRAIYG